MEEKCLEQRLRKIKGKTIAIVYIFEGDNSCGFEHFYIWKSNIITKWMNAVQDLSCLPLVIDVRTFVEKAINQTLPHIDFVINMNSGTYDLSTMALVPAMCSAIDVPCLPCNAVSITAGENKNLSNLIASSIGLNVPKTLDKANKTGIFRPISLGNSLGVKRGEYQATENGIYQEFIQGIEITTPLCFNAETFEMEILPTVAFIPNNNDPNWYYGEEAKKQQQGYRFQIISLEDNLKKKYYELVNALALQTYCRIDARIKCNQGEDINSVCEIGALLENTYFIEINVMPTIRNNNSFCYSFSSVVKDSHIYRNIESQRNVFGTDNIYGYLLAHSMLSFMREDT